MDRDRRQPQTRRDLAGRRAAPGSRSARPRLRDHAGAHCALSAGADVIEALVLTGFLGSGKTTLLGHLLRQPEFSRTAVIINEFGEIGLDHDLVDASEPVLAAQRGQIDPACLFDGRLYDPLTKSLDVPSWLRAAAISHGHAYQRHDVDTYAIVRRDPIRAVALTLFLETISEHCGADLLRLKGIVNILESPDQPAVIHGVQHVFHPPSWLARWPSDDRRSRIVFITRGIPRGWVEALLETLDAEVVAVSAN